MLGGQGMSQSSNDEIQMLLDMTYNYVHHPEPQEYVKSSHASSKLNLKKNDLVKSSAFEPSQEAPETIGIIYWLEKTAQTLVVRLMASENMNQDSKLLQKSPDDYPSMKYHRLLQEGGKLSYYELPNFLNAQYLENYLANRRLVIEEDKICNLSDSGHFWKCYSTEDKIIIYTHHAKLIDPHIETFVLGPMGVMDTQSKTSFFSHEVLALLFPIQSFSHSSGIISIHSYSDSVFFRLFKQLVIKGKTDPLFWQYLSELIQNGSAESKDQIASTRIFLQNFATIRKFWLHLMVK
jgi:hypothetical protein